MTTDEFLELHRDPRFIKGISNYCDSWCARCAFTSRCFNFAQRQAAEAEMGFDPTDADWESKRMMHVMENAFTIAQDLIRQGMAEDGIDIHSPEFQASMDESEDDHERRFEEARAHPLMVAAEEYAFAAEAWFERAGAELERRIAQAQRSDEIRLDELQPEEVEDAIEVIRWYQFQASFTLVGILGIDAPEGLMDDHDNGKIKTLLIGLDRSLPAWGRVQLFWPRAAEEIMHLAGLAAELRLILEEAFPNARDFIRPGFDEASLHVM